MSQTKYELSVKEIDEMISDWVEEAKAALTNDHIDSMSELSHAVIEQIVVVHKIEIEMLIQQLKEKITSFEEDRGSQQTPENMDDISKDIDSMEMLETRLYDILKA